MNLMRNCTRIAIVCFFASWSVQAVAAVSGYTGVISLIGVPGAVGSSSPFSEGTFYIEFTDSSVLPGSCERVYFDPTNTPEGPLMGSQRAKRAFIAVISAFMSGHEIEVFVSDAVTGNYCFAAGNTTTELQIDS